MSASRGASSGVRKAGAGTAETGTAGTGTAGAGNAGAGKDPAGIVAVGTMACAACCAGPIVGALSAVGIGTVAGTALFGFVGLLVGAIVLLVVLRRRHRSTSQPTRPEDVAVSLELSPSRSASTDFGRAAHTVPAQAATTQATAASWDSPSA